MLGYKKLSDISCCYRTIDRVEQKEEHFDKEADNHFRYFFRNPVCKGTQYFDKLVCLVYQLDIQKLVIQWEK